MGIRLGEEGSGGAEVEELQVLSYNLWFNFYVSLLLYHCKGNVHKMWLQWCVQKGKSIKRIQNIFHNVIEIIDLNKYIFYFKIYDDLVKDFIAWKV